MKTIITLITMLFLAVTSFAQDFENAGVYNEYINKQQQNVVKKYLSYNSAVAHGKNARKVDKQREKLMDEIQESRMNIGAMPSFNGDKAFRDSTVSFLRLYFNVLNEDYSKIVNMEEIAEQSYDLMEAYLLAKEKVDEKMEEANKTMRAAQMNFAANNNMKLISNDKDDLSVMMKQVSDNNEYYNKVYLVFFKSYKQELYLMDAIEKEDLNGIEQNKSALTATVTEGLAKLAAIGAFQGDNAMLSACKNMLQFYQREAEKQIPGMVDFFLKKDRFATMKKEMEKKSADKRTQADIDAYNKAVNEMNAAGGTFNNVNKELYNEKNDRLKDWNESVDAFFKEHTPKYKD